MKFLKEILFISLVIKCAWTIDLKDARTCLFSESVNITDGVKDKNGNIEFNGLIYNPNTYSSYDYIQINRTQYMKAEKHLRGCVCKVSECVRLCKNHESHKRYANLTINGDGEYELVDLNKYNVVYGKICETVDTNDGEIIKLMRNGSVLVDDMLLNYNEYCLNVEENGTQTIASVQICFMATESDIKQQLYPIGMLISFPFLILTFLIYAICPELQTLHGKNLMCYVFSLIMLYASLSMVYLNKTPTPTLCKTEGYTIYFFGLACFFWLNILCFEIWTTIRGGKHHKRGKSNKNLHFFLFFLYAFGISLVLTVFVYLIDNNDYVGSFIPDEYHPKIGKPLFEGQPRECFLTSQVKSVKVIYFYSIAIVLMTINAIFFVATSVIIYKVRKATKKVVSDSFCSDTKRFHLYLRLFTLMGICWIMEPISWFLGDNLPIFYLTDLVNSLQGVIIFMMFVMKQKVWKYLKKRCGCGTLEPGRSTMRSSRFSLSRTISSKFSMSSLF